MNSSIIIFDFDGTLADSFDFVSDFLTRQAGKEGLKLEERRRRYAGLTMWEMAQKLRIPLWRALWLFFHGRRVMTRHINEIKPFPGMRQVVKTLHGGGYQLFALSSNRNANIQIFLKQHGLEEYFTGTQGSASILGKPLALRRLLWHYNLEAQDCVYIGDEAGDIEAAHRMHMHAMGVTWGYNNTRKLKQAKPYAVVDTPAELVSVLRSAQRI